MKAIHLCPVSKKDASLFPTTHQHAKGDLLLLFVAPQWFNRIIFFQHHQAAISLSTLRQRTFRDVLLLCCKKKKVLSAACERYLFCLLKMLIHPLLPVYKHCLLTYCVSGTFKDTSRERVLQPFLSSENKLSPHLRQGRGTPSPFCGSSRLPRVLVGHWWVG